MTKILLIADNPDTRELLTDLIQDTGYEVTPIARKEVKREVENGIDQYDVALVYSTTWATPLNITKESTGEMPVDYTLFGVLEDDIVEQLRERFSNKKIVYVHSSSEVDFAPKGVDHFYSCQNIANLAPVMKFVLKPN